MQRQFNDYQISNFEYEAKNDSMSIRYNARISRQRFYTGIEIKISLLLSN